MHLKFVLGKTVVLFGLKSEFIENNLKIHNSFIDLQLWNYNANDLNSNGMLNLLSTSLAVETVQVYEPYDSNGHNKMLKGHMFHKVLCDLRVCHT